MPLDSPALPPPVNATEAVGKFAVVSGKAHAYGPSDLQLQRECYTSHFATCPNASQHRTPAPSSGSRRCTPFVTEDGKVTGFVCGRAPRGKSCQENGCNKTAVAQCDYPLAGRKAGKTCSRYVCEQHRHQQNDPGPGTTAAEIGKDTIDYCPTHDRVAKAQGKLL